MTGGDCGTGFAGRKDVRDSPLLAPNGPSGMSVQCPLSGVKQTSRRKAASSGFDPSRASGLISI